MKFTVLATVALDVSVEVEVDEFTEDNLKEAVAEACQDLIFHAETTYVGSENQIDGYPSALDPHPFMVLHDWCQIDEHD